MNNEGFVHLHVHNEYSLLDGFGSADAYCERAVELGFKHLALTNHGNVDGCIKFQRACDKAGIHSILGMEAYIVEDMSVKAKGDNKFHMTLIAKNDIGWKNLLQIATYSNIQGFYRRPRIDSNLLMNYLDGIIVMTACCYGFIRMPGGKDLLYDLAEKTDVFMEIMPVYMKSQEEMNRWVLDIHKESGIPIVATMDCHYPLMEHSELQEVLLAIQTKKKWDDPKRWKFDIDDLYLKSTDEMIESFRRLGGVPEGKVIEAMENTMTVANLCELHVDQITVVLPEVDVPQYRNLGEKDQLIQLTLDGLDRKANKHNWIREDIDKYYERISEELDLIFELNFERYFLIVWELIGWCKKNDIMVGPGRGCFAPNNFVLTDDGLKSIKDISPGKDHVLSANGKFNTVSETFEYDIHEDILLLTIGGTKVLCTNDHKFLTPNGYVRADELCIGEGVVKYEQNVGEKPESCNGWANNERCPKALSTQSSIKLVEAHEAVGYRGKVYDLKVDGDPSYNIEGLIVHNSVGGCLSAFLLGITSVDSLYWNLPFSRFISPARIDLPDIDMDFEDIKRSKIRKHLEDLYGKYNVTSLSTFSKLNGRSAIRDISRVFDLPYKDVDGAAKSIVVRSLGDFRSSYTIEDAFNAFEDGIKFKRKYPRVSRIAIAMEGQTKNAGKHAAAMCVAKSDLRSGDNISLSMRQQEPICSFDKYDAEHLGLMKLDVLGLNALTVLHAAKKLIEIRYGTIIDYEDIPFDDKKVLDEFTKGNTAGVFQFASHSMIKLCREIHTEDFEQVISLNALNRPGCLRCVVGDTKIKISTGWKRIDSLKEWQPVMSSLFPSSKSMKQIKNHIDPVINTGLREVYEIKGSRGDSLVCTAGERFFVRDKGWCELSDVLLGDKVLTIQKHPEEHKNWLINNLMEYGQGTRFKAGDIPINKGVPAKEWNIPLFNLVKEHKLDIRKQTPEAEGNWRKAMFGNEKKWGQTKDKIRAARVRICTPEWCKEQSKIMVEYYKNNPHPNESMITVSKPQARLFAAVHAIFETAVMELKIISEGNIYFLDIAVPEQKINIEYDGEYWHDDPGARHEPRDSNLELDGWTVLRVTENSIDDLIIWFESFEVSNSICWSAVESITFVGERETFDLSMKNKKVPNYIANNFVVHNSGMATDYKERKHGEKKIPDMHPIMSKITKNTFGIVLFQEQIMYIMYDLAGLPWKTADMVRKVISKSTGEEQFMKFKEMFINGCKEKETLNPEESKSIFEELKHFGSYGFNRAHSVEYAMIAYWDMWLKVKYPVEFIVALLSFGPEGEKKLEHVAEAKRLGLKLLLPNINKSLSKEWEADEDGNLLIPFCEIKGIGPAAGNAIIKHRGLVPFVDKDDFISRVPKRQVNSRAVSLLESVGAFDISSTLELSEERLDGLSELFDFDLSNDPMYRYKKMLKLMATGTKLSKLVDVTTKKDTEKRLYFGRILNVKFGYKEKVKGSKDGTDTSKGLGGVYGNLNDGTDFAMLTFNSDLYESRKNEVEHCAGQWLLAKGNSPFKTDSVFASDVWFGDDLLKGNAGGLGLELAKEVPCTDDFTHMSADLGRCTECSLRSECRQPVLPSHGQMNIMICGEAPGVNEDREGEGFIGDAGDLLFGKPKVKEVVGLAKRGIQKSLCHITNIVKCYPKSTRTPKAVHIRSCSKWLETEISIVKPFVILSFGNTGLKFFKGIDSGIMSFNATTEWNSKFNCWVCYSVHPASVLYDSGNALLLNDALANFVEKIGVLGFGI